MFPWENWLVRFYQKVYHEVRFQYTKNTGGTKLAIITETKSTPLLRLVIYNFAYFLLPLGWRIHLVYGNDNKLEAEQLAEDLKGNLSISLYGTFNIVGDLFFQTDCVLLKDTDVYNFKLWSNNPVGLCGSSYYDPVKVENILKTAWERIFTPLKWERVLETFGEVGFVGENQVFLPNQKIHLERWKHVEKYLLDYKQIHGEKMLDYYFTLFDGWREHTEPCKVPVYVMATEGNLSLLSHYVNKGSIGEGGRFIPKGIPDTIFPYFDKRVLAFCRHKGDDTVITIPDPEFIRTGGYIDLQQEIDSVDIEWEKKKNKLYWRGGSHGIAYKKYGSISQRAMLVEKAISEWLDASFSYTVTKESMLQYKYLVDVDGEVNAWSGLWWKLYSNSVVFKVESHYEQWFYKDLVEWVHYIPVKGDLSDLEEKYKWALENDMKCKQIALEGKKFTTIHTYEYVLKNYVW